MLQSIRKRKKINEDNLRDLWKNIKSNNILNYRGSRRSKGPQLSHIQACSGHAHLPRPQQPRRGHLRGLMVTAKYGLGGDFPGGPVVKTLCFYFRGHRFDPWSGN